jgi:adenosylmethionine-8-amino-7-oxononanoate aminotransferase
VNGDMVMVGPPLIIEDTQIDEIMDILKKTFSQMEKDHR